MSLLSMKRIFIPAGAFVSYTIGAGFASGNEVLQFFGSWGFPQLFLAIAGAFTVTMIYCICLYKTGQAVTFRKTSDAYSYFGGKGLGWFIKFFVFIFVFGSFMLMFSGAGSLLTQFYGIPQWVGALLLGVLSGAIVLGGLKTVENILGLTGVVILVYLLLFGAISLFHPFSSLDQASGAAEAVADGKVWQANLFELPPLSWLPSLTDFNSPLITGALYGALCLVSGFPFYLTLGKRMKSSKEALSAAIITTITFYLCISFVLLILLFNFESLIDKNTNEMLSFPTLAGIHSMWPSMSWTYIVIIFMGILTSTAGYLWVLTDWFFPGKKNPKGSAFTLALIVFGGTMGGVIPFSLLINFLFPLTGLAGLIITAAILVRTLKGNNGIKRHYSIVANSRRASVLLQKRIPQ